MIVDLVCKMLIDTKASNFSLDFEGETYVFCSEGCLEEFKRHTADYLKPDYIYSDRSSEGKHDV